MEFRSLLGEEETPLKTYADAGIRRTDILDQSALDAVLKRILKEKRVALATATFSDRFIGFALTFGNGESFFADAANLSLKSFFETLLASDIEIVGFDLKEDLKSIWRYLDDANVPASGQLGIF